MSLWPTQIPQIAGLRSYSSPSDFFLLPFIDKLGSKLKIGNAVGMGTTCRFGITAHSKSNVPRNVPDHQNTARFRDSGRTWNAQLKNALETETSRSYHRVERPTPKSSVTIYMFQVRKADSIVLCQSVRIHFSLLAGSTSMSNEHKPMEVPLRPWLRGFVSGVSWL